MTLPTVPVIPGLPSAGDIAPGLPVRGSTWRAMSSLSNYLLGRGSQLVVAHNPNDLITKGPATTATYRYRVWPAYQMNRELWCFSFRRPAAGLGAITISIDSGTAHEMRAYFPYTNVAPVFVLVDRTGATGAEQTRVVEITNADAAQDLVLTNVGCCALPRPTLDPDTVEYGVLDDSCTAGEPIYDVDGNSYGGVRQASAQVGAVVRRRGLFHWATNDTLLSPITSGSFVNPFLVDPILLAPNTSGSTTTTTQWRVDAFTDGSTEGEVRLTAASGDTTTITIPSSTSDWVSGALDVHTEDLTSADGRRASTWDEVTVEWRRSSGSGDLYIYGISAGVA